MSATLEIYVSRLKKPCQHTQRKWYITIYSCDGDLMEWCGKKFLVLPTNNCGYLKVNLPPGKYKVSGVWNFYKVGDTYHGNHFTDSCLVTLCCNSHKCIELFNPNVHRCGVIFNQALDDLRNQLIKGAGTDPARVDQINQTVDQAIAGNQAVLALAGEVDPDLGVQFEEADIQEHNEFVRKRIECEECTDLFDGEHDHSDDDEEKKED